MCSGYNKYIYMKKEKKKERKDTELFTNQSRQTR